ncbi:MAG: acyl carrier protein [Deltaproteobacteria bacterium]|nr:acyl carrier protein [Deltaproteobacteria bacterium]
MSQAVDRADKVHAAPRAFDRASILERVREILADSFEIEPETIQLESHLIDDLDLDSIDAIDLAVELEQETGLRLEEQELRRIRRVKDIVDLVCDRLVPA